MFDLVTKNRLLVYIVLGLIILTFAFFGVDSYFQGAGQVSEVATIGDAPISVQEYGQNLRQAQDLVRQQAQQQDAEQMNAYINSPEFRRAVLDDLIQRRLLLGYARAAGMSVSVDELRNEIMGVQAFYGEDGIFSVERYEQLLRAQNMTPAGFEAQIEQEILLSRIRQSIAGSAFIPESVVDRLVRIRGQEREVSQLLISPVEFREGIEVSEEDVRQYFEENNSLFRIPERAKVEYLVLTPEVAAATVEVPEEDLKRVYEDKIEEFQSAEERRASHILIAVGANATDEEEAAAKSKVDELAGQLQAAPNRFGELARANSQDPGSAEQGGDLGFFQRGFMVAEFEKAAFALDVGQVSEPVRTQYGFHIIRVDEVKPVVTTPFAEVREQLLAEVRESRVQDAYLEAAQAFSDMVYTEYDSLKPTADALGLTVQSSDWISPAGGGMNPLLNSPELLEAVFSAESLEEKRNTQAMEVQPNTLLSARVVEHAPPQDMVYEDVSGDIVDFLKTQQAVEMATQQGAALLEQLTQGENPGGLKWSKPGIVTLQKRQGLHPEGVRAVFSADTASLPTYAGLSVDDGRYVIYRISAVNEVESVSPDDVQTASRQLSQMVEQEQYAAFVGRLRERSDVVVNEAAINPDQ